MSFLMKSYISADDLADPVEIFCDQIAGRFFGMEATPNPVRSIEKNQPDLIITNHPALKSPLGIWVILSPILTPCMDGADFGIDPMFTGFLTVDQLQLLRGVGAEKYWVMFWQMFDGDINQGVFPALNLWVAVAEKLLQRFDSAELTAFRQGDRFLLDLREFRMIKFCPPPQRAIDK